MPCVPPLPVTISLSRGIPRLSDHHLIYFSFFAPFCFTYQHAYFVFKRFTSKHQQEILNPAELCQGGYQGTDSSSFSQNSEGLGVKSQGSAQPLPHVAWIKSKIIFE